MQVYNSGLLVQWLQNVRGILAVETSAAEFIRQLQHMHKQYPVMAIRGISDIVGLEGDPLWREYACQTAATFTYAFITTGIFDVSMDESKSTLASATTNTSVVMLSVSAQTEKASATELETAVEFRADIFYYAQPHISDNAIYPWSCIETIYVNEFF